MDDLPDHAPVFRIDQTVESNLGKTRGEQNVPNSDPEVDCGAVAIGICHIDPIFNSPLPPSPPLTHSNTPVQSRSSATQRKLFCREIDELAYKRNIDPI